MSWTAVVPLKAAAGRKSRLAPELDLEQRLDLSERLFRHVSDCLVESGAFVEIILLTPDQRAVEPPFRLCIEQGELNCELERLRADTPARIMVINSDLPLLNPADIRALIGAATEQGCAVAPDRHGSGTNAVALMPGAPFSFAFGSSSLARHEASAGAWLQRVERIGLAYDLDTFQDIRAMAAVRDPLPPYLARLLQAHQLKGIEAARAAGE